MSALARDAAAFKTSLQRQDFTSWHSNPAPPTQAATSDDSNVIDLTKKKKKPKANVVYSQPADTGTGSNINTQLVYAVDHLKVSHIVKVTFFFVYIKEKGSKMEILCVSKTSLSLPIPPWTPTLFSSNASKGTTALSTIQRQIYTPIA